MYREAAHSAAAPAALAVDDPQAARKLAPQPVTERRRHGHRVRVAVAHEPLPGIPLEVVPSTYLSERLTPLSGGIRDGAHPRVASPPPCPGSTAARSGARARPWPMISVSGSCCSSARTPTTSVSDAVRRSPPHGQGIPVGLIQLRARHRRFAKVSVA